MATPPKRLPVNPSPENIRKQAKRLARTRSIALSTAQHQLAREYGAQDWAELLRIIDRMRVGSDSLEGGVARPQPLPAAARARDRDAVRRLLAVGGLTQHDLNVALAHALWYGDEQSDWPLKQEIADLLLEHGADPDGQYGAAYGPIVLGLGECLQPRGLRYLIDAGADVAFPPVQTKYGLACPLSSWLSTYLRGRGDRKREGIDLLLAHDAHVPAEITPELLAIHRDDDGQLAALLDASPQLASRRLDRPPYIEAADLTLLHYACEFGADRCARLLAERGADVNDRSREGVTPLHLAARGASAATVRLLLDHGARPWLTDEKNLSPQQYAAQSQANPQRLEILDLLTRIEFDDDAFAAAVAALDAGDVERLAALLAEHPRLATARLASPSALTRGYFSSPTLLHFVANNPTRTPRMPPRVLDAIDAILDAGVAVDAVSDATHGGTTLALVASSAPAHADDAASAMIERLVRRGANPAAALSAAILHRFTDTARLLLRLGAPLDLLAAAGLGETDALRALLRANPPADGSRDHGASSAELLRAGWAAAMNGHAAALELLLDAGLNPNARLPRPYEPTMLHEAACFAHREVCELLLSRGADATIRDSQFHGTPADWARHAGHAQPAELLDPPP